MTCIGLFLIFRGKILYFIKSISLPKVNQRITESRIKKHIGQIFKVITNGKHIKEKMRAFVFLSFLILISMSIVMFRAFSYKGVLIALVMAFMPYGYVRTKLFIKQVNG